MQIKPQKELVKQRCDWPTEGEAWVWDCHERKPATQHAKKQPKRAKAGGAPS